MDKKKKKWTIGIGIAVVVLVAAGAGFLLGMSSLAFATQCAIRRWILQRNL